MRELISIVERFAGVRIAVLGDFVADEFVYGDITRVSREAPVLILQHRRTEAVPGGAGNAVANLRALDAVPVPVGVVGRDAAGDRLVESLRRAGVPCGGIARSGSYATPAKSRVLAGGVHTRRQQIVRLDSGAVPGPLPAALLRRLGGALRRTLPRARALLVADYGYGAAPPEATQPHIADCRRRGLPVCVDSRGRVDRFRGASACTPNHEELELAVGRGALSGGAVAEAARRLLRRTGNDAVLVTRGAEGMELVRRRLPVRRIPAYGSGEVTDVTGAGDTVVAVYTLANVCGADPLQAARLANCAAGLVVAKAGTATLGRDELIGALRGGIP